MTPAGQAARASWLLRTLRTLVPPRVHSAVFSSLWNRWTTARRFQKRAVWLLHYCTCPVTRQICLRRLRLTPSVYACAHGFLLAHPGITTREDLTMLGLLHYGIYSITNYRRRNGANSNADAYEAISQSIIEGVKGHAGAMRALDSRWQQNSISHALPPIPLLQMQPKTIRLRKLGVRGP